MSARQEVEAVEEEVEVGEEVEAGLGVADELVALEAMYGERLVPASDWQFSVLLGDLQRQLVGHAGDDEAREVGGSDSCYCCWRMDEVELRVHLHRRYPRYLKKGKIDKNLVKRKIDRNFKKSINFFIFFVYFFRNKI
jgi:hypothetical protein